MHHRILMAGLSTVMAVIAGYVSAEPEADAEDLQKQIDSLKQDVEQLSKQLSKQQQARPSGSGFNPDISLVLVGTYANLSQDPDSYSIAGISLGPETSPGPQGLSLAETELVISANVDDWFYGRFTGAITPDNEFEVEEAFIQTTALPAGFAIQAGRFFSELGYLNPQHAHSWDFVDQPLIYRAFLANQYRDDGVQLRWLAPTDFFLEFGGEVFRGDSYPAGGASNQGVGTYTAFVSTGNDLGDSHSWKAGLSYLNAKSDPRETEDDTLEFFGETELYTAYLVWKWSPHGNPYDKNFKFQTALMQSPEKGDYSSDVYYSDVYYSDADNKEEPIDNSRSGWYGQFIYQFLHGWRAGLRLDLMHIENPGAAFSGTVLDPDNHNPSRYSVMLDYAHSEFGRLRLQYNRDNSGPHAGNEIYLQYVMSLGAHGAHRF